MDRFPQGEADDRDWRKVSARQASNLIFPIWVKYESDPSLLCVIITHCYTPVIRLGEFFCQIRAAGQIRGEFRCDRHGLSILCIAAVLAGVVTFVGSTLKPLGSQERIFSTTSGSILPTARYQPITSGVFGGN
jgi:hypothetical protein